MTERIKVLYIAGSGRTGSTILERILGQFEQIGSYGELRFIWDRGYAGNWPCGCTKPFRECDFWQAVMAQTFDHQPIDIDAVLHLNQHVDRTRYVPQILGIRRTQQFKQDFEAYTALLQKLYAAIIDVSGKPIIVDASKFDSSGFILGQMPGIELHVLHLVRDSRAVAFSWQRRKMHRMSDGRERPQVRRTPVRAALEWLKLNALAEVMRWHSTSYQRLRYEDFIQNPSASIAHILQQIDQPTDELTRFLSPTGVTLQQQTHTVAGNPNRLDYGEIPLRLDDEWQRKLPPRAFALVTLLTLPGLLRYGYPLGRQPNG
ncbi:MAG: hypothetical protein CL610_28300 [Anaerolineaceae bacterium]|nr:hypothetical protein [Anaerolineaceae bacterium]